jgi:integrase
MQRFNTFHMYLLSPRKMGYFWGYLFVPPSGDTPMPESTPAALPRRKALTDSAVKTAKPREKDYKLGDSGGLFLLVKANGGKYWRMKYRLNGKEQMLAIGVYPDVSLAQARTARDKAKAGLHEGINPTLAKQEQKRLAARNTEASFEHIAREWYASKAGTLSPAYSRRILASLELNVFPMLGRYDLTEISAPMLLDMARQVEKRGALEVASRAVQACGTIIRYAIATGRANFDPTPSLKGALKPRTVQHMARIPAKELPELLTRIKGYDGDVITRLALELMTLTFVRTGELIAAEWAEIDLAKQEWRIPAARMKMRQEHIVPLSRQALALLDELALHTGNHAHLFNSPRSRGKHMSNNTILFALYRMGYHGRMTGHGFRGLASTILNEQGYKPDVIERQLAHAEQNEIRAAYNHAEYLPERREMMQHWADYLDRMKGGNVIPLAANERK